jgi:thiazole/oxazole-forming peptide maturase SagD family component
MGVHTLSDASPRANSSELASRCLSLRQASRRSSAGIDPAVLRNIDRMVSPLLGPVRRMTTLRYDPSSPAVYTVLPELTDIHRRTGMASSPEYHLGGYGFLLDEALRRALGEAVERSAQVTFHTSYPELVRRHSRSELLARGVAHVPVEAFARFSEEQWRASGFPLSRVGEAAPINWVPMVDLREPGREVLVPLQAMVTGYTCVDEPRGAIAVSTGTAAHLTYERAMLSGLLEMLQIDATMGHWYGAHTAPRIDVSPASTPRFARFLKSHRTRLDRFGGAIEFYWLQRPDDGVPIYVVACAVRRPGDYPALALGLGVAVDLEAALYSALIEAIPVSFVALMNGLQQLYSMPTPDEGQPKRRARDLRSAYSALDLARLRDFDAAVGYYALPEHAEALFPSRFDPDHVVGAPEIRCAMASLDPGMDPGEVAREVIAQARRRYELYALDFTAVDAKALGYRVVRVYSPDLLLLSLPSYPEKDHQRYAAYGGVRSTAPHPYP